MSPVAAPLVGPVNVHEIVRVADDDMVVSAQVLRDGMNIAGVVVENPFAARANQ